jgi:hypothetical protein
MDIRVASLGLKTLLKHKKDNIVDRTPGPGLGQA